MLAEAWRPRPFTLRHARLAPVLPVRLVGATGGQVTLTEREEQLALLEGAAVYYTQRVDFHSASMVAKAIEQVSREYVEALLKKAQEEDK